MAVRAAQNGPDFFDSGYGKAVENLSASRYAPGQKFTAAAVPESQPDQ